MSGSGQQRQWWESLQHSGLILGPREAQTLERDYPPAPLSDYTLDRLRREVSRFEAKECETSDFVAWVLRNVGHFPSDLGNAWFRGSDVPGEFSHILITGEAFKPRLVWKGPKGGVLPVFVDKHPKLGVGKGRKITSDVVQWLRLARLSVALLTNGRQWRLVHAGLDYDAFCQSDLDLWFEEGTIGAQLNALRQILQPVLFEPGKDKQGPPLATAISASRRGQSELSSLLGERVREAVEELVRAHGELLKEAGLEKDGAEIYRAAVRVVMRLVVVLFAESRDLLPRDNPVYYQNYGLQGLFWQLERLKKGSLLRHRVGAWPRVLALFRLIYEGSHHEALTVLGYGGALFSPSKAGATGPVEKALAIFESGCFDRRTPMPDSVVHRMLELLTRTPMKLPAGWTVVPVDFSDLSSEYIGILYEGLLDYELKTAPVDQPVIFLPIGDEPALPLKRVEEMEDAQLKALFEEFKKPVGGEQTAEDSEEDEEGTDEEAPVGEAAAPPKEAEALDFPVEVEEVSGSEQARQRALTWAARACVAAGLVFKPKGKLTPEKELVYKRAIDTKSVELCRRLVLPGDWYLVRWGGTRKGAGSFYTRPQLAIPTVQRTLRPLAYVKEEGNGELGAGHGNWIPKKPEEILALKVCDPGCGSGSFDIAALRFLTEALYESLYAHGRLQGDWHRPMDEILGLCPEGSAIDAAHAIRLPCPPAEPDFEPRAKAVLRRYVVERCIYGVDLDPLAVELCRLALWIETMDRDLPFSFLDHKIKVGNSLVGCWFDNFRHYPVMAWKREGGDKTHSNGVHFGKEVRTKALKEFVENTVKPDLVRAITGQGELFGAGMVEDFGALHDQTLAALRDIQNMPVDKTTERGRRYTELLAKHAWQRLKATFDLWCSCWFWPADRLDVAPLATTFASPAEATLRLASEMAARKRFFHWELEFPDVFDKSGSGFDAMVGNPPWDVAKPNSKEFFSNTDPLYRSYGKQEALKRQTDYFADPAVEQAWLDYNADFKAQSNFVGVAAFPFGDPDEEDNGGEKFNLARGKENGGLHRKWRDRRHGGTAYADSLHSFRHQGSADLNLYKLFLEQAHTLLRAGGRLGFIVPSGIYSDHGSGALRTLFLDHCQWEWLFGFENREGIFKIHRSFKFNPVIVRKGGKTEAIQTAFMRRRLEDWAEAEQFATPYARERVTRFSPKSKAILEIQSARDLEILEKIYANSVLLGDDGPDGWGIQYAREFDMTNDSKLFPPRPQWEAKGFKPDEYSRWILGKWRPIGELWKKFGAKPLSAGERRCAQPPYDTLPIPRADIPVGIILSRNADEWIEEGEIADIALPLYEGRMIGQFDFSQKGWVSGKSRTAVWRTVSQSCKMVEPQYLMGAGDYKSSESRVKYLKMALIAITSATNRRSLIESVVPDYPCCHVVPTLFIQSLNSQMVLAVSAILNSFTFDYVIRPRLGSGVMYLSPHLLIEDPIPVRSSSVVFYLSILSARLTLTSTVHSDRWSKASSFSNALLTTAPWRRQWAITDYERMRVRCIVDATVAGIYGVDREEYAHILADCDYDQSRLLSDAYSQALASKGFWRVDKDKDPELRHTVLTLVAFHDLQQKIQACGGDRDKGIEAFLNQNNGEGWMLPETLRLADYGLGHDDRAKEPQPVAARLGPRFYDWQLAQSPEESWRECELHARNLLGEAGYEALLADIEREKRGEPGGREQGTGSGVPGKIMKGATSASKAKSGLVQGELL
jgi:hypothetical protein